MRTSDQTEIVGDLMRRDERTGIGESAVREVIGDSGVHAVRLERRYVDPNVRWRELGSHILSNRSSGDGGVEGIDGGRPENISVAQDDGLDQIVGASSAGGREDSCGRSGPGPPRRRRRFVRPKVASENRVVGTDLIVDFRYSHVLIRVADARVKYSAARLVGRRG